MDKETHENTSGQTGRAQGLRAVWGEPGEVLLISELGKDNLSFQEKIIEWCERQMQKEKCVQVANLFPTLL